MSSDVSAAQNIKPSAKIGNGLPLHSKMENDNAILVMPYDTQRKVTRK